MIKCKDCGINITFITLIREALDNNLCNKCYNTRRKDLDRRTRCGHDRADDKQQRELMY